MKGNRITVISPDGQKICERSAGWLPRLISSLQRAIQSVISIQQPALKRSLLRNLKLSSEWDTPTASGIQLPPRFNLSRHERASFGSREHARMPYSNNPVQIPPGLPPPWLRLVICRYRLHLVQEGKEGRIPETNTNYRTIVPSWRTYLPVIFPRPRDWILGPPGIFLGNCIRYLPGCRFAPSG